MDKDILEKMLNLEEFEAWEIGLKPNQILDLLNNDIISISYKTNKKTFYKPNKQLIKKLLQENENLDHSLDIPEIILQNEYKEIIEKCIKNKISCLLYGPPGTSKTLFLLKLKQMQNTIYFNFYITAYELIKHIVNNPDQIILIDQIDNLKDKKVYNVLIDALEYGYVLINTHTTKLKTKFNGMVIATANDISKIPEPLLSRFLTIRFKEYTNEEYNKICFELLKNITNDYTLIDKIIQLTKDKKDIRKAIKLAKICKNVEELEKFKSLFL